MTDVEFVVPVLGSWNHIMQAASIRVRSWEECGLNADMAFWAAIDPKRTCVPCQQSYLVGRPRPIASHAALTKGVATTVHAKAMAG